MIGQKVGLSTSRRTITAPESEYKRPAALSLSIQSQTPGELIGTFKRSPSTINSPISSLEVGSIAAIGQPSERHFLRATARLPPTGAPIIANVKAGHDRCTRRRENRSLGPCGHPTSIVTQVACVLSRRARFTSLADSFPRC